MPRTLRAAFVAALVATLAAGLATAAPAGAATLMTCTFTGSGTFVTPVAPAGAVFQLTGYNYDTGAQKVDCAFEIGAGLSLNQKGRLVSDGWYDAPVTCGLGQLFDKVGWTTSTGASPDISPNTTKLTLPSGTYDIEYITSDLAGVPPAGTVAKLLITDFVLQGGTNLVGGTGEGEIVFTPKVAAGGGGVACITAIAPTFDMTGKFTVEAL